MTLKQSDDGPAGPTKYTLSTLGHGERKWRARWHGRRSKRKEGGEGGGDQESKAKGKREGRMGGGGGIRSRERKII
jgi:hypothetical protein